MKRQMLLGDKVVDIIARNRSKVLFELDGDRYVSFISRLKDIKND